MNTSAFHKLSYGLFMIAAKEGEKLNGSIINTVTQITSKPYQISFAMNKSSYTHDMVLRTKKAVITVLSENTAFETFKHFGFQSGRDVDKFKNFPCTTTEDGIPYLTFNSCAYFACTVTQTVDMGSHTLFIADVTAVHVAEKYLDEKGSLHLEDAGLLAYSHGTYYSLGKALGHFGYSIRKKKPTKRKSTTKRSKTYNKKRN